MAEVFRVYVEDKYAIVVSETGGFRALRHGEDWRDLVGDGLTMALAREVIRLHRLVSEMNHESTRPTTGGR